MQLYQRSPTPLHHHPFVHLTKLTNSKAKKLHRKKCQLITVDLEWILVLTSGYTVWLLRNRFIIFDFCCLLCHCTLVLLFTPSVYFRTLPQIQLAAAAQMAAALGNQTGIKASAQPGSKTKDQQAQKKEEKTKKTPHFACNNCQWRRPVTTYRKYNSLI